MAIQIGASGRQSRPSARAMTVNAPIAGAAPATRNSQGTLWNSNSSITTTDRVMMTAQAMPVGAPVRQSRMLSTSHQPTIASRLTANAPR